MPEIATIANTMTGHVAHHAGHVIGYTSKGDPIYCSGHTVTGVQTTGSSKVIVQGFEAARLTDHGTTTCPCCGQGYTNATASSKVIIEGLGAVRVGDGCDIHGVGSGNMVTGRSKVIIA